MQSSRCLIVVVKVWLLDRGREGTLGNEGMKFLLFFFVCAFYDISVLLGYLRMGES